LKHGWYPTVESEGKLMAHLAGPTEKDLHADSLISLPMGMFPWARKSEGL
jgi:hypothetical protein